MSATGVLIFPTPTDAEARDAAGWLIAHELAAPREQLTFDEYMGLMAAVKTLTLSGVKWDAVISDWAGRVPRPTNNMEMPRTFRARCWIKGA